MSNQYSPTGFSFLPVVVKNLLIINGIMYLADLVMERFGIDLSAILGLHFFLSSEFYPHQLITYMFMHGNFAHLFFNMFALWMFGNTLENIWGTKRFLWFYMLCGIGAGLTQELVAYIRYLSVTSSMDADTVSMVLAEGSKALSQGMNYVDHSLSSLNILLNVPTVGASGAIYGLLLAFGMMFPNSLIYLYFAIPIKAKWFVIAYAAIELLSGIFSSGDHVAHFAHLGGMLVGFIIISIWKKKGLLY